MPCEPEPSRHHSSRHPGNRELVTKTLALAPSGTTSSLKRDAVQTFAAVETGRRPETVAPRAVRAGSATLPDTGTPSTLWHQQRSSIFGEVPQWLANVTPGRGTFLDPIRYADGYTPA